MKLNVGSKIAGALVLAGLPAVTWAFASFQDFLDSLKTLINNSLLPLIVAIALVFFFWGLARFILKAGDEKAREEGKKIMVWGIVALFIMVSIWGIVNFLQYTFDLQNSPTISLPQF